MKHLVYNQPRCKGSVCTNSSSNTEEKESSQQQMEKREEQRRAVTLVVCPVSQARVCEILCGCVAASGVALYKVEGVAESSVGSTDAHGKAVLASV